MLLCNGNMLTQKQQFQVNLRPRVELKCTQHVVRYRAGVDRFRGELGAWAGRHAGMQADRQVG